MKQSLSFSELTTALKQSKKITNYILYISPIIGFIILFDYFYTLNYFPTLNFKGLIYIGVVGTYTTITTILPLILGLYLLPAQWNYLFHTTIVKNQTNLYKASGYSDIKISVLLSFITLINIFIIYVLYLKSNMIINAVIFLFVFHFFIQTSPNKITFKDQPHPRLLSYIYLLLLFTALPCSFLFLAVISMGEYSGMNSILYNFIYIVMITLYLSANIGTNINIKRPYLWPLFNSFCIFMTLLLAQSSSNQFVQEVIKKTKMGNIQDGSIIVNQSGCEIIKVTVFPDFSCRSLENSQSKYHQTLYQFEHVNILWRINEYYLEFTKVINKKTVKYRLIIPQQDVIRSIAIEET